MITYSKFEEVADSFPKASETIKTCVPFEPHTRECEIYLFLWQAKKGLGFPSVAIPRSYGSSLVPRGQRKPNLQFILLEDLTCVGSPVDFVKGMAVEQCMEVVIAIAELQVLGLMVPGWQRFGLKVNLVAGADPENNFGRGGPIL